MVDYSGNIVHDAAMRGPKLILNELQSLTTDLSDLTHDCNFHQVLTSHVVISSINASLSWHVQSRKTAPIDFMTISGRWMITPDCAKKTMQSLMTRKGEAHEPLSLLFHRDGVPPTMVFDGSKEQCKGDFKRKIRKADCHARQTEPYTLWQQAAEACIRELKRGVSRKMIKTGSSRILWDH
jgi:hypothetical protein